jgi:hypothetical protein
MNYKIEYNEIMRRTKKATLYRFEDGFCEWLANSVTDKYKTYIEIPDYVYNSKIKSIPHKLYKSIKNKHKEEKIENIEKKIYKVEIYKIIQRSDKSTLYFLETGSSAWVPNAYCKENKDHIEVDEYIYNLTIKDKPHNLKIDRRTKEYKKSKKNQLSLSIFNSIE